MMIVNPHLINNDTWFEVNRVCFALITIIILIKIVKIVEKRLHNKYKYWYKRLIYIHIDDIIDWFIRKTDKYFLVSLVL